MVVVKNDASDVVETFFFSRSNFEEKLRSLQEHYSESEVVDLTLTISLMNCLNRMAISFGDKPSARAG